MDIKKNKESITISFKTIKFDLQYSDKLYLSADLSDEVKLDQPGEYEYFGLLFQNTEIKKEKYISKSNIITLSTAQNASILVYLDSIEIPKDIIDDFEKIDVLITSNKNIAIAKDLVKKFQPFNLVIVNIDNDTEDNIKNSLSDVYFASDESVSKVSINEKDFVETEDDTVTQTYILK